MNPLTEATAGLEEVKVTIKPEEAEGETTNGGVDGRTEAREPKLIV